MKKEVCRHFQRGSCRYGERCKYLHVTPQQSKPNPFGFGNQSGSSQQSKSSPFGFGSQSGSQQQKPNPFGFGNQSQSNLQQRPNPFGFGVQNNSSSKGFTDYGSKQNQFKPFENKWTRPSATSAGGALTKQTDNRSQVSDHLLPCDIVNDISCEELRATAYDDAKHGLSLQSIVERERKLLNAKLIEFQNLRNNPYAIQSNSMPANQNQFPGAKPNAFSNAAQNSTPSLIPGFSQMGSVAQNMSFGTRPPVTSNNSFGQLNSFPNGGQTSNALGSNSVLSVIPGFSGSQGPEKPFGSFHSSNMPSFGNGGITKPETNPLSAPAPVQNFNSASILSASNFKVPEFSEFGQAAMNTQPKNGMQKKNVSVDASIWLKEKWMPGEIPEEAPPDEYCR